METDIRRLRTDQGDENEPREVGKHRHKLIVICVLSGEVGGIVFGVCELFYGILESFFGKAAICTVCVRSVGAIARSFVVGLLCSAGSAEFCTVFELSTAVFAECHYITSDKIRYRNYTIKISICQDVNSKKVLEIAR